MKKSQFSTTNTHKIIITVVGIAAVTFFLFVSAHTNPGTNIDTETAGYKWGWNDAIGWINMHGTHTVKVTAYKITGYASSSVGSIVFDCSTPPSGGTWCNNNANDFHTVNDGTGQLSGWAWNDAIGWISLKGTTADNKPYGVRIDPSGDNINSYFHGWAWSDVVGWINFNCNDFEILPGGAGVCTATQDYKTQTSAGSRTDDATFTSNIIDIGTTKGIFNTIMWRGSQPGQTKVQFAITTGAVIGDLALNPITWFDASAGIPIKLTKLLTGVEIENRRYMRYWVSLKTDNWKTVSPQIDDIFINYSP